MAAEQVSKRARIGGSGLERRGRAYAARMRLGTDDRLEAAILFTTLRLRAFAPSLKKTSHGAGGNIPDALVSIGLGEPVPGT